MRLSVWTALVLPAILALMYWPVGTDSSCYTNDSFPFTVLPETVRYFPIDLQFTDNPVHLRYFTIYGSNANLIYLPLTDTSPSSFSVFSLRIALNDKTVTVRAADDAKSETINMDQGSFTAKFITAVRANDLQTAGVIVNIRLNEGVLLNSVNVIQMQGSFNTTQFPPAVAFRSMLPFNVHAILRDAEIFFDFAPPQDDGILTVRSGVTWMSSDLPVMLQQDTEQSFCNLSAFVELPNAELILLLANEIVDHDDSSYTLNLFDSTEGVPTARFSVTNIRGVSNITIVISGVFPAEVLTTTFLLPQIGKLYTVQLRAISGCPEVNLGGREDIEITANTTFDPATGEYDPYTRIEVLCPEDQFPITAFCLPSGQWSTVLNPVPCDPLTTTTTTTTPAATEEPVNVVAIAAASAGVGILVFVVVVVGILIIACYCFRHRRVRVPTSTSNVDMKEVEVAEDLAGTPGANPNRQLLREGTPTDKDIQSPGGDNSPDSAKHLLSSTNTSPDHQPREGTPTDKDIQSPGAGTPGANPNRQLLA